MVQARERGGGHIVNVNRIDKKKRKNRKVSGMKKNVKEKNAYRTRIKNGSILNLNTCRVPSNV